MLGVTSSPDIHKRPELSLPASSSFTSVILKSGSSDGPKPVNPSSNKASPESVGISSNVFSPVTNSAVLTSQNSSPADSKQLAAPNPGLAPVTFDALSINANKPEASFSLTQGPLSVAGLINTKVSPSVIGLSEPSFNPQSAQDSKSRTIFNDTSTRPGTNTGSNTSSTAGDASTKPSDKPESVAQNIFAKEPPVTDEKVTGSIFEPSEMSKRAFQDQGSDSNVIVEQQILAELSKRDTEVKGHEQAHSSVGGNLAQSPRFSYEQGSDGKRYAVDGEVSIDISVVRGDPLATVNKMRRVYAAAMAPANPSMADIRVASEAMRKMNQAQSELSVMRQSEVMTIKDMAPLIDAQAIIDGFTSPESPEVSIAGEVDRTGAIRRAQPEENNIVGQTIEMINGLLKASAEPTFELLSSQDQTEAYLSDALLAKYLPENKSASSLSFSV